MFTNNFYTILKSFFCEKSTHAYENQGQIDLFKYKTTEGSMQFPSGAQLAKRSSFDLSLCKINAGSDNENPRVWFGSGVGAATAGDFRLEKEIPEDAITVGSAITETGVEPSGDVFTELTVRIIAAKDVTVGEVGWFILRGRHVSEPWIMVERTVLASPIVLKKGDIGFIKYRVTNASVFSGI